MTPAKSTIRAAIGTAVILLATSLATAYGAESATLKETIHAKQSTLPGTVGQVDPCGPKNSVGKLGY